MPIQTSQNGNVCSNEAFSDSTWSEWSLMYWTKDTIKKVNMPLVRLMDGLYQFTRSEKYRTNSLTENRNWMNDYQKRLCEYFDINNSDFDSISSYAKSNYVIQQAETLWNLDNDGSTMGLTINKSIKKTRCIFQDYNELSNFLDICSSESMKTLIRLSTIICQSRL